MLNQTNLQTPEEYVTNKKCFILLLCFLLAYSLKGFLLFCTLPFSLCEQAIEN